MDDFLAYPLEAKLPHHSNPELQAMAKFRRALCIEDQLVMDELLHQASQHWPLQSLAGHMSPLEFALFSMLLEQKKVVEKLRIQIARLSDSPVHPPFP
jgi:hypothetical protein